MVRPLVVFISAVIPQCPGPAIFPALSLKKAPQIEACVCLLLTQYLGNLGTVRPNHKPVSQSYKRGARCYQASKWKTPKAVNFRLSGRQPRDFPLS